MKTIICKTDNAEIFVDDEDFHWLSRFPWYRGGEGQHPMTFLYGKNGKGRPVYMHQLIMGGAVNTDHIDLNVLNMQKSNLRVATHQLNGWNKGKQRSMKKICTSQYKGVSYRPLKGRDRWLAHFKYVAPGQHKSTGKYICVGYFWSELEAAQAYDKKVREMRGEWAWTNTLENNKAQVC